MTYLIANVVDTKNNNTDNVGMIKSAEDLHLAPDAALVALDLLLGDNFERDLDGEALVIGAGGVLDGLREGGEMGRGAEAVPAARVRARRDGLAS